MKKLKYVIAITTGVLFDLLFWEKMYGFSFALFISVFSVAVLIIEKIRIRDLPRLSLIPYFLAILFALLTFIRLELFTTFLNMSVSALMLTIAVLTLKSGRWPQLGFTEYLRYGFHLIQQVAAFPIGSRNENSPGERQQKRKTFISVLRGLFFAIPAVIIFTFLLSEADLIFSDTVNVFIEWINWERISEILARTFLILFMGNLLLSAAVFARKKSAGSVPRPEERPLIKPFLGRVELLIIFGGVLVVFAIFVGIQFRYFFFAQDNISASGYTYAQYARRGFGELVTVALFSLILVAFSVKFAKYETKHAKMGHFYLVVALVLCVMVILASAFQRLLLYERAYGFTRLRMYSHLFMIWLGLFLVAAAMLTLKARPKLFTNAAIIFGVGFTFTLNLVNVDAAIVRQNIRHASASNPLDTYYLESLSSDALPALIAASAKSDVSESVLNDVDELIDLYSDRLNSDNSAFARREKTHFAGIYGKWLLNRNLE